MSKEALRKLSSALNVKDPNSDYRNKTINPQTHGVDTRATSITEELTRELNIIAKKQDTEILKYVKPDDIKAAASEFRRILMGQVKNPNTGVTFKPGSDSYIIGNFNTISSLLKQASDAAIVELKKRVAAKTQDYIPFFGKDKLVNLDHTRTVAEMKISQDISNVKIDPLKLITALRSRPLTSKVEYDDVYNNILEIFSYFTNNNKTFEIKGTVEKPITGTISSARVNQTEGQEIKARKAAFKKAIELAIKDYNWPEQEASDSFKTAALKQINNATVKAGGSGKIQTINRNSNKAENTKTSKQKRIVTNVQTINLASKTQPKAQSSAFSIQSINDYINERLPAVVKNNMGFGSLVNRTGRFAESTRVVNGVITPQNYLSLGYTYQRSPYDVFDRKIGRKPWNTPGRNPSTIIEKSIREIAKEISIGRFYLRRI